MLKKIVFAMVVCTCVSVAFGAAVKIETFAPMNDENEFADAMAILNFKPGGNNNVDKTIVQIIMSDFSAGMTYDIFFANCMNERIAFNAFTTNQHGHASYHAEVPFEVSTCDVELYFDLGGEFEDLRALGSNTAG